MAPPEFVERGNRSDAGSRLQDRHDLGVPNLGQRVRPPARRSLLRGQPRVVLDPIAGRPAEARLGGSNGGIVGLSVAVCRELMCSLVWWSVIWRPGNV